jgi:two-component system, chemotaxis family, chemotaxis protein CheY
MVDGRLQRMTVLICDDNQNMRELLRAILQALGVVHIIDGREGDHAIQKLRDFNIDLVITDWAMEPKDGLDLTRWIRNDPDSPDQFMPVIMVTGHTEMDRITKARDAGVTEFIAKPVSARSLYQRLCSIIQNPRPFVRTKDYFGPDRRRKSEPFTGPDRRQGASTAGSAAQTADARA